MQERQRIRATEALIISQRDFGEADRLVLLFSRELGKMRALAKGVRRTRSRKAGHLQPITCAKLLLAKGTSFWIITQAEAVQDFKEIKSELSLIGHASYLLELADKLTTEEHPDLSLYNLLLRALGLLAAGVQPFNIVQYAQLRMLELAGYKPELQQCVQCRAEIQPQNQYFSASRGGVLCPKCGALHTEKKAVDIATLKYLRFFQRSDMDSAVRARIDAAVQREMQALMDYFLSHIIERRLNSANFLNQLNHLDVQ